VPDETREALLSVAREIIEKRGYLGLSMRTVSAAAGVTPDVARRYYQNRDALFAAAMKLPANPSSAIPTLVGPGIEGMGESLVRFMLDTLRDPEARAEIVSLARSGANAGHAMAGMQDFLERSVVDRIAVLIGVPDARMRAALISSYLIGIAMTRYGVRLEPLASASEEEVIRMVAPVVQDLLDPRKPIPGSARSRERSASSPAGDEGGAATSPEPAPPRTRTFIADPKAHAEQQARAAAAGAEGPAGRPREAGTSAASTSRTARAKPGSGTGPTRPGSGAPDPAQEPVLDAQTDDGE
jgi:AcrR family transcriptional regulator